MQEGNEAGKGEVLLAVFERPPEATGDTINSAVVIASESAASYPGLKKVEDYLGPLTELATAKGFKAEGEPYALDVESRHLLRADFVKPRSDKLTMRQCTLVLLAKGQIVSFTFIAGSEDELDESDGRPAFRQTQNPPHTKGRKATKFGGATGVLARPRLRRDGRLGRPSRAQLGSCLRPSQLRFALAFPAIGVPRHLQNHALRATKSAVYPIDSSPQNKRHLC